MGKKNEIRFPPISEGGYSRFDDDGWGIRDVRMTKRGEEALAIAEKEEKDNDKGKDESGGG